MAVRYKHERNIKKIAKVRRDEYLEHLNSLATVKYEYNRPIFSSVLDEVMNDYKELKYKNSLVVPDLNIITQPRFVDILEWFIKCTIKDGIYDVEKEDGTLERITRIILKGGRGSVKSSLHAILMVLGVYTTRESGIVIMKTQTAIRQAAYAEIQHAIRFLKLTPYFKFSLKPLKITLLGTETCIIFEGCDPNVDRLKSIKSPTGYFKYVWMEEANMIGSYDDFVTAVASVIRGNDIKTLEDAINVYNNVTPASDISPLVLISFNPHEEPDHWSYGTLDVQHKGIILRHANYTTVPVAWLSKAFDSEVGYLLKTGSNNAKRTYINKYLGMRVYNSRLVFDNIVALNSAKNFTPLKNGQIYYGMDFNNGGRDPYAFVVVRLDMTLRIMQVLYSKFSNVGTAVEFIASVRDDLQDFFPIDEPVQCDNSKELVYLANEGYTNFYKARKQGTTRDEKDSMRMNGYELLSLLARIEIPLAQEELLDEFRNKKRVEKNGVVKRTPEDGRDHGIDAIRYAIWPIVYSYITGVTKNKREVGMHGN